MSPRIGERAGELAHQEDRSTLEELERVLDRRRQGIDVEARAVRGVPELAIDDGPCREGGDPGRRGEEPAHYRRSVHEQKVRDEVADRAGGKLTRPEPEK